MMGLIHLFQRFLRTQNSLHSVVNYFETSSLESSPRQEEISSFDKGRFLLSVDRSTCAFIYSSIHLIVLTNNRKSCV